ncbi:MAG: ATP-binding protein [Nocardioidaceae bacterium]
MELDPDPRSVQTARLWVRAELAAIDRTDLGPSAELGVSELVTNALLHGEPPVGLRLAGTPVHPRIEVSDGSQAPPAPRLDDEDARLLATIGRGLAIVAVHSTAWGADVTPRGKVVWFEPVPVAADAPPLARAGHIVDLNRQAERAEPPDTAQQPIVHVCLVGLPLHVYARYRIWYEESRRELRLLSLHRGQESPLTAEFADLTGQVAGLLGATGASARLDAALRTGHPRADVELRVPAATGAMMGRLLGLLEEADAFARRVRLLSLPPGPQLISLRSWFHGEFERQGRGEAPRPWSGSYEVEEDRR